jgi:hypothetical protein
MDNHEQKVVLLGASNLGGCASRLRRQGKQVIDLTQPGWLASKENIESLSEKLKKIDCNEQSTLAFDLFGNSSFRFEQFDGSLSMPFKQSGSHHLAGKIVTCPPPVYKRILDGTADLFTTHKTAKIIIVPPLPRYLFRGCCHQKDHSTNVREQGHSSKLLSDTISLRNTLKKFVASLSISRCLVMDSCCIVDCPPTANITSRIESLKSVCAQDGVHFKTEGYDNLVACINKSVSLLAKSTSVVSTSKKQHYWRGFKSLCGSASVAPNVHGCVRGGKAVRGGRHFRPFHPYRRGK